MNPEMTSSALVELLRCFEGAGIEVWLDGGWGVDALLETQTRPHKDVDIIVRVSALPTLCELLLSRGRLGLSSGRLCRAGYRERPGRPVPVACRPGARPRSRLRTDRERPAWHGPAAAAFRRRVATSL